MKQHSNPTLQSQSPSQPSLIPLSCGYYFDIETYSPHEVPDPKTDKIITIQFQKIEIKTGKKVGELQILKEWEEGEEAIIKFIHKWFFKRNPWQFIPIGFNLNFEWKFLSEKFKHYNLDTLELGDFLEKYPQIDLKVLAVLKKGTFMGSSLSYISQKEDDGYVIKEYYEHKEYDKIEKYIKDETDAFIELYQKIIKNIDTIL
jgi:DNA polymerase elongation subunit (family B)